MQNEKHIWQGRDLAKFYLEDVRGALPLAAEQMDAILRITDKKLPNIGRLLDLGCGDGILGRTVLTYRPEAQAVFVDFSEHMIEIAKQKVDAKRSTFVVQDFGLKNWTDSIKKLGPFDLVVSGLAIHHQPDAQKRAIYADIFDLLNPGGLFLHLEHVASKSAWEKEVFEDLFVDYLWAYHKKQGGTKPRDIFAQEYHACPGHGANILAPLDLQCRWLEEIGFVDVDCFLKIFEITLFGGRKN